MRSGEERTIDGNNHGAKGWSHCRRQLSPRETMNYPIMQGVHRIAGAIGGWCITRKVSRSVIKREIVREGPFAGRVGDEFRQG